MTQAAYKLIIKGSLYDAIVQASSRGIPFVVTKQLRHAGWTVGEVPGDYREKVAAWFFEGKASVPFPNGTLLYYQ
jgi:hypothetical protein